MSFSTTEQYKHKEYGMSITFSREDAEKDPFFMHYWMGKHAGFKGRKYRRGENRCLWCGSPNNAHDNLNWLKELQEKKAAEIFKHAFNA